VREGYLFTLITLSVTFAPPRSLRKRRHVSLHNRLGGGGLRKDTYLFLPSPLLPVVSEASSSDQ